MRRVALIAILILFLSLPPAVSIIGYSNVTVSATKNMIDSNPSLIVLDVRTQSEYDSGHIRNGKHIPVGELEGRLDELETADEILVYCRSGGRSATASQILADNGFSHVYNMLGGITAWIDAGYPVYVKYSSIQEAINSADGGDTIFVSSGTYYENVVVNKTLTLIGESRENTIIDGSGENQTIIKVTASSVVISRFTVQNCSRAAGTSYAGIKVSGYACNITYNFVTKSKIGIFVTSKGSRIADNVVENNGQGIALYSSSEVIVEANNVSANTVGISLALSFNNRIMGNRALNSYTGGHGITLSSNSFNNTIRANELMDNYHGMWLSSSSNNSILENTIANNKLLGIELANSADNTFYHNNFINNGLPPYAPSIKHVTIDSKSESIWDNGCEGNYWNDYNGTDMDGDGIGDIPYFIHVNNTDNYPLMNLYWNPADVNHDLKVDIYDVVLACNAYGSTPSDPNWNGHCDIAEPYGVIDIYDIVVAAGNYGESW